MTIYFGIGSVKHVDAFFRHVSLKCHLWDDDIVTETNRTESNVISTSLAVSCSDIYY